MVLIEHPSIGVPILLILAFVMLVQVHGSGIRDWWSDRSWSSAGRLRELMQETSQEIERARVMGLTQSRMRAALERIREHDPNFSLVLFEDFVHALYAEVQRARGEQKLASLEPWLGPSAVSVLSGNQRARVTGVVIGAIRYLEIWGLVPSDREIRCVLEIEANVVERSESGEQRWYRVERWTLARDKAARTPPPEKARVLECRNCGAPLDALRGNTCSHCQQPVGDGRFDWVLRELELVHREARREGLTGHAEERGTERPTVVDPEARARYEALCAADPAFEWPALTPRLGLIFTRLQDGWSRQDLSAIRPFVTDGVLASFEYWIDAYRGAGLRNVTENARILGVHLSRVVEDTAYWSITVRVFATSLDYTLSQTGVVVGGSREHERRYTEYWTLIRGATRRGAPRTDPSCPNCGAPVEIEMSGHCAHCRVKVTSGDFDWVLSRIEQDDAY